MISHINNCTAGLLGGYLNVTKLFIKRRIEGVEEEEERDIDEN